MSGNKQRPLQSEISGNGRIKEKNLSANLAEILQKNAIERQSTAWTLGGETKGKHTVHLKESRSSEKGLANLVAKWTTRWSRGSMQRGDKVGWHSALRGKLI